MSRIEDNEAERAERIRQEQKLQDKRVDAKRVETSRQFNAVVSNMQQTRKHESKQDQQRGESRQSASRQLLARRGIDTNKATGTRLNKNTLLNEESRKNALDRDGEQRVGRRQEGRQGEQQAKSHTSGETRAVTGQARGGRDTQSQSRDERRGKASTKEAEAAPQQSFAVVGQAVAGIGGLGAKAGSLGGPPRTLSTRELIDQIVAQVRQGIDQHGFGLMQIDLRDDVLAGSRLTFMSTKDGVHVKLDTGDQDVERLLCASGTRHELSRAMAATDTKLTGFEVNGTEVL